MVLAMIRMDPLVLLAVGLEPVRESQLAFEARLEQGIRDAIASGEFRADLDPPRLAGLLRILHHALIEQLVEPGWIANTDDALIDTTFDALLTGLAQRDH